MRLSTTLIAMMLFAAAAFAGSLLESGEPYYDFARGEILVQFDKSVTAWDAERICRELAAEPVEFSDGLEFWRVKLPDGTETDAVERFRARPDVVWANFNYIARACYTPNDAFYVYQWHLPRMNLPQAWDLTRGDPAVIVAVCDMGFQFDHTDWEGVQTIHPRDCIQNDDNPEVNVYDSHGEHVAGTIIAATNNNRGVAGIAPLCTLMPIRVLSDSGSGTMSQISNGINWATTHGAHVINLSLVIPVTGPPQNPGPPLSTAITNAGNAGVVICAGSGNDYQGYVGYPAAYTQCIAVGATGFNDMLAPYSNRGTALDVVAPGGNLEQDLNGDSYEDGVLSTVRDQSGDIYVFWQGTSMATPHASGLAALLLSYGCPANLVRDAMQQTAVDLGTSGWDATYGYGRINAFAALQWANDIQPPRPAVPQSIQLNAPYPNPFNNVTIIPLELSNPARVELVIRNVLGQRIATLLADADLTAGKHSFAWHADGAASGLYIVTLQSGNFSQTRKIILLK